MANFKRKRRLSKTWGKCSICGSQRRGYGWGDEKTQKKMKVLDKELRSGAILE